MSGLTGLCQECGDETTNECRGCNQFVCSGCESSHSC